MTKISLADYRLHINEGEEKFIPKYGLESDFRNFDLDSLIRLYGREAVSDYLKQHGIILIENRRFV